MLADIVTIAAGTFHSTLMKTDGSVWSSGVNSDQIFEMLVSSGAVASGVGSYYNIIIAQNGNVRVTGKATRGQLRFFDASATGRRKFSVVQNIPGAKAIAAGGYHSMVMTHQGLVWGVGWNKYGQIGDGSTVDRNKCVVSIYFAATAVAAGEMHSIVLKRDGTVWATGRNNNGQLGDGSKDDKVKFGQVMDGGAAHVAAGGYHSMVVKDDGGVWAAGCNEYGQLGDGSRTDRTTYVMVVSSGAKNVAVGSRHSMMLKQDGSVWTTGYNQYGQLGDGSVINKPLFGKVMPYGADIIAAGAFHSMVLKQDGSLWATGSNQDGQFGDGTTTSSKSFVRIEPFSPGAHTTQLRTQKLICTAFRTCICSIGFCAFVAFYHAVMLFFLFTKKNVFITFSPLTVAMYIIAASAIREAELAKTTILVKRETNDDGS